MLDKDLMIWYIDIAFKKGLKNFLKKFKKSSWQSYDKMVS